MLDINNISYNNQRAWDLIKSGNTKGVFQLESNLGSHLASKIQPRNVTELAILISLMRPASLQSGMTETYIKNRNSETQISFGDPDVDRILENTNYVLTFQEDLMALGSEIAWKDLPEMERLIIVNKLRKSVSKKKSDEVEKLKPSFIAGCIKNGKSQQLAERLFSIIQDAGRYAFNKSHAMKYAHWAYKTAYLKSCYPYEFYTSYLTYSRERLKPKIEISGLINEAKMLNIKVDPPDLRLKNAEFAIQEKNGKKTIAYGLSHIKQVGVADIEILKKEDVQTWQDLLALHYDTSRKTKLRRQALETIIESGAVDYLKINRKILLNICNLFDELTPAKELKYVMERIKKTKLESLRELLIECGEKVSVQKRKDYVKSEAKMLNLDEKDTYTWRANKETALLGINMTCTPLDDLKYNKELTCKECYKYNKDNKEYNAMVAVTLDSIVKTVTKKGKNPGAEMAHLTVSDATGQTRFACFPTDYEGMKDILETGQSYQMIINGTGNGWAVKKSSLLVKNSAAETVQ